MKIKGLTPSVLVPIEISGSFHSRIQSLLLYLSTTIPNEEFIKCCQLIKTGGQDLSKIKPIYFHIETIIALISTIEQEAITKNLVTEQEIDSSKTT